MLVTIFITAKPKDHKKDFIYYVDIVNNCNLWTKITINAAIALYGEYSNKVLQVRNAWAAVGVGTAGNLNCITLNLSAISICYDDPFAWAQFPITITANFSPADGIITWNVPPDFDFTISPSGNQITLNSGPLTPDVFLAITATLTSGVGNPVTATTWYSTYQCQGGFIMKANEFNSELLERTIGGSSIVYPNPANSYINVRLTNRSMVKISDLNGSVLLEKVSNPGLNRITTEKLRNGIYILYITENGKTTAHKIVINK